MCMYIRGLIGPGSNHPVRKLQIRKVLSLNLILHLFVVLYKSYLGLLNYYNHFLPNLSTTLHPLHALLCKFKKWTWSPACEKAFNQSKRALVNSPALAHYDTSKPIRLTCDASPYKVGAVISQVEKNGQERPVAFASKSLSTAKNNTLKLKKRHLP